MRFAITNAQYINSLNKVPTEKNLKAILKAMDKYGDNNWWVSADNREVAFMQLHEDILLVPFDRFHEGIEELLNRPVWTHEFGVNVEALKKEAKIAWEGGKDYTPTEEEITNRVREGIKSIANL